MSSTISMSSPAAGLPAQEQFQIARLRDSNIFDDPSIIRIVHSALSNECRDMSKWTRIIRSHFPDVRPLTFAHDREEAVNALSQIEGLVQVLLRNKGSDTKTGEEDTEQRAQVDRALIRLNSARQTLGKMGIRHQKLLDEHVGLCVSVLQGNTGATYSETAWKTLIPQLFTEEESSRDAFVDQVRRVQKAASMAAVQATPPVTTRQSARSIPSAHIQNADNSAPTYLIDDGTSNETKWAEVRSTYKTYLAWLRPMLGLGSGSISEIAKREFQPSIDRERVKFERQFLTWQASVWRDAGDEHSASKEVEKGMKELMGVWDEFAAAVSETGEDGSAREICTVDI